MNPALVADKPINTPIVLLITAAPDRPQMRDALNLTRHLLQNGQSVRVFFYGAAAAIANAFCWQPADVPNIAEEWATLNHDLDLPLPVCVSAALARGVTDAENAQRHGLQSGNQAGDNLRAPFYLAGLGEFALLLATNTPIIQFGHTPNLANINNKIIKNIALCPQKFNSATERLIILDSSSELVLYETLALAFLLASFDERIILQATQQAVMAIANPAGRAFGMVQSLNLYDISPIYVANLTQNAHKDWVISPSSNNKPYLFIDNLANATLEKSAFILPNTLQSAFTNKPFTQKLSELASVWTGDW